MSSTQSRRAQGRAVARNKSFAVTGTLGVLELAADRGLLDLADALIRLKGTGFRCRQDVIEALPARHKNSMSTGLLITGKSCTT